MLVIYGIPDKVLRATPPSPYTWNGSYIEQAALFGTFFLSHSIFLEGWLLPKLRRVNWLTAMPPVHFRLDKGGEWIARMGLLNTFSYASLKKKLFQNQCLG